jgi:hypothetical protein
MIVADPLPLLARNPELWPALKLELLLGPSSGLEPLAVGEAVAVVAAKTVASATTMAAGYGRGRCRG